jgi:hypothetical protein
MKREIKFKALRSDGKGWVYGYYVLRPDGKHLIYWKPFKEATQNTYHEIDPETVCQFTGLQDKNGMDIYEGDNIMSFKREYNKIPLKDTVRMKEGCFRLCSFETTDIPLFNYKSKELKIIGNIHDKTETP